MASHAHFVKYDVKVPRRSFLKAMIALGWIMTVACIVTLFGLFVKSANPPIGDTSRVPSYCRPDAVYTDDGVFIYQGCHLPEPASVFSVEWLYYHWYYVLALLLIGSFVATYFSSRLDKYYRIVRQGKIKRLDIVGGGFFPPRFEILVEGHTYANELRRQWHGVSAGYWRNAEVGDWIDLR
jgi:hypothetical protein